MQRLIIGSFLAAVAGLVLAHFVVATGHYQE
jgi:hypothetical protein